MVTRNILAQSQLAEVGEICGTISFPEKPILLFLLLIFNKIFYKVFNNYLSGGIYGCHGPQRVESTGQPSGVRPGDQPWWQTPLTTEPFQRFSVSFLASSIDVYSGIFRILEELSQRAA